MLQHIFFANPFSRLVKRNLKSTAYKQDKCGKRNNLRMELAMVHKCTRKRLKYGNS